MEEDLKYLEDLLPLARMLLTTSQKATIQEREIQAIENLIKAYKELEEKNEELKADNKYLDERVQFLEARRTDIINKFQNEITDTTIPKSKVREKIESKIAYCRAEELEDNYIGDKHSQYWGMYRELLEKLEQELLEEE